MNYQLHYNLLMSSRLLLKEQRIKENKQGIYYEGHHIIPKCLGGKGYSKSFNNPNIVLLTPKEHFLSHYLLYHIYKDNFGLTTAFMKMCTTRNGYIVSSRVYNECRSKFSILMKLNKGNVDNRLIRKPLGLTMLNKNHSNDSKIIVSKSLKDYWNSPQGIARRKQLSERMIGNTRNHPKH